MKNLADWEKHCQHASAIASIIQIQMAADSKQTVETTLPVEPSERKGGEQRLDSEELNKSFGPKTAEMPDLTKFPSSQMKDFIDVGSLPDHLHEKAWSMLERRVKAFGFDGRLGHLKTKVHIRTQDGQVLVFAGPVRWTGKKTEIELNPTAKDQTTGCGCTNSEFFRLPVAMFVEKSKNRRKPV